MNISIQHHCVFAMARLDEREDNCCFVTSMSSDTFEFVPRELSSHSEIRQQNGWAKWSTKYSNTLIAAVLAYSSWDEYFDVDVDVDENDNSEETSYVNLDVRVTLHVRSHHFFLSSLEYTVRAHMQCTNTHTAVCRIYSLMLCQNESKFMHIM